MGTSHVTEGHKGEQNRNELFLVALLLPVSPYLLLRSLFERPVGLCFYGLFIHSPLFSFLPPPPSTREKKGNNDSLVVAPFVPRHPPPRHFR
jgi:hypothetical protein